MQKLDKSSENLVQEIIHLVYYMRGAVTYEEMWRRTPGERDALNKFISKILEGQKGSLHPVY